MGGWMGGEWEWMLLALQSHEGKSLFSSITEQHTGRCSVSQVLNINPESEKYGSGNGNNLKNLFYYMFFYSRHVSPELGGAVEVESNLRPPSWFIRNLPLHQGNK